MQRTGELFVAITPLKCPLTNGYVSTTEKKACFPETFEIGDLVEVKFSFAAVGAGGQCAYKFRLVPLLKSITLISSDIRKVSTVSFTWYNIHMSCKIAEKKGKEVQDQIRKSVSYGASKRPYNSDEEDGESVLRKKMGRVSLGKKALMWREPEGEEGEIADSAMEDVQD